MAGDINEISEAIGGLRAQAEETARWRKEVSDKLEAIAAALQPLNGVVKSVGEMQPHVDDFKKLKQRGLGILGLAGLGGYGLSHFIPFDAILKKLGLSP